MSADHLHVLVCPRCSSRNETTDASGTHTCPQCGLTVHFSVAGERPPAATLDTPTIEDTVSLAADGGAVPRETVGTPLQLGRFTIVRMLGEGGYSRVYLARDEQLDRSVALKVPKVERFQDAAALVAFFQEARTVAGLDHPNIVRVYDVGQDESTGVRYIVMQHIEGDSLDVRIVEGRLAYAETAEIVRKVALALHAAHKRQFFHRDIKPSNILLSNDGEPFLADFGLAVDERAQLDRAGEFAGTVPYMSPEQVRGETHHLDGRADIWSLGMVLYRMLTGRIPFRGKREQLVAEILEREPRPPRQIDETIPKELERICLRCLRKRIPERYSSAFDLAEELQAWQASASTGSQPYPTSLPGATTAPVPPVRVAGSEPRRVGGWMAVGAMLLAAAAGSVAVMLFVGSGDSDDWKPTEEPEIRKNLAIDEFAVRGVWYDLLAEPPVELDPPTARDSSLWNWKHDSQLREVQANIPDLALIELGATTADSYRLRATINKTNWNGQTGLFWGHRPVNGGAVLAAWQAVTIHAFPQDGKTKVRIHYEAYHREHDPRHKYPRVFSDRIALKDLDTPPLFDNELEVRIVKGRLVSVTWRGVEVPELSRIAEPGVSGASRSGGSFGLYVANGATVFRDARFRLDNEGND